MCVLQYSAMYTITMWWSSFRPSRRCCDGVNLVHVAGAGRAHPFGVSSAAVCPSVVSSGWLNRQVGIGMVTASSGARTPPNHVAKEHMSWNQQLVGALCCCNPFPLRTFVLLLNLAWPLMSSPPLSSNCSHSMFWLRCHTLGVACGSVRCFNLGGWQPLRRDGNGAVHMK